MPFSPKSVEVTYYELSTDFQRLNLNTLVVSINSPTQEICRLDKISRGFVCKNHNKNHSKKSRFKLYLCLSDSIERPASTYS